MGAPVITWLLLGLPFFSSYLDAHSLLQKHFIMKTVNNSLNMNKYIVSESYTLMENNQPELNLYFSVRRSCSSATQISLTSPGVSGTPAEPSTSLCSVRVASDGPGHVESGQFFPWTCLTSWDI